MSGATAWTGCHGVALRPDGVLRTGAPWDLGRACGEPLVDAAVRIADAGLSDGVELWNLTSVSRAGHRFGQRLERASPTRLVLDADGDRRIALATQPPELAVSPPLDQVQTQLLTAFALPALVNQLRADRALVVHGAAAAREGRAVLLCGPGGAGKSSALVGLTDAGWAPVSEDVCVVDLRADEPLLWPGPPWVRRAHDEPGPRGAPLLFRSSDKTAWSLAASQIAGPVPLRQLVLLDPPGRGVDCRPLTSPAEVVAALAPHAVWLGAAEGRGRALFGPVATVASRVMAARVRLRRHDRWVDDLVELLDQLATES